MKRSLLISAILASLLAGCSSTEDSASDTATITNADSRMMECNVPNATNRGPVRASLFVTGTFPDGQWDHSKKREMHHKGEGLYQMVSDEKAGKIFFQFASISWNPQYTASGKKLNIGQIKQLKRGGFMQDTAVTLPADGKYVWSIQLSEDKKPISAVVAQCK